MRRREFLAGAAAMAGAAGAFGPALAQSGPIPRKGRIKQGLWRTNFGASFGQDAQFSIEDMCREASRLGVAGFDLFGFDDIPLLESYGLKLLLAGPGQADFLTGVIHPEAFEDQEAALHAQIDLCAQHGVPSIALNAGQLRGLDKATAADNAVAFFKRIKTHLEEAGVSTCMENVNDHRPGETRLGRDDMAFGHWDWGVDVCARVDSPNVKMICDIYHLQIMDGDVSRRIRDTIQWIGHFHVAGVPTRYEIDDTQELNYRYIAQVIAETGYDGYVSHEWRPAPGNDPLESLARAIDIMDV